MSVINEVIRAEIDDSISFGDYSVKEKKKKSDFEFLGDTYNVKTHNEVTRLEKNGSLLLETVPGAAVYNLKVSEMETVFSLEGQGATQVTMELEGDTVYKITVGSNSLGKLKSTLAGKINFSVDLADKTQSVGVEKVQ